jgi:hypothetical protein
MMVKILILLECDHCEEAWPTVVSLRNQLGIQWDAEIQNVEYEAEQTGWSVYRCNHTCDGCVLEAMAKQNSG